MTGEPEIVNIVGSGQVPIEIELSALRDDLPFETAYIEGPGLYFKFREEDPTITVARSGKYIITGSKSKEELERVRKETLDLFFEMGLLDSPQDCQFSIKNMVFTAEMDAEINLSALAILIGMEDVEYEPEQFPGLIYRPNSTDAVVLVFGTGKIVITGGVDEDDALAAYQSTRELIKKSSDI